MRKDCPEPSVGRKFLIEVPFEPLPSLPINANKTNGILFFRFLSHSSPFPLHFLFVLCKYVHRSRRTQPQKCARVGAFTAFIERRLVDVCECVRAVRHGTLRPAQVATRSSIQSGVLSKNKSKWQRVLEIGLGLKNAWRANVLNKGVRLNCIVGPFWWSILSVCGTKFWFYSQ